MVRQESADVLPPLRCIALALLVNLCAAGPAFAYIGPSYLHIAGVTGEARPSTHRSWIRAESNYWTRRPELQEIRGINGNKNDLLFTGPLAPGQGPEMLAVSIDKASPAIAPLMKLCRLGTVIPAATFAESSDLARHPQEHGPRPRDVPAFYEYALNQVRLSCPVVAGAPEQAFALHFASIEWLNYRPQPAPRAISAKPALSGPGRSIGARRAFAITWFAAAVDSGASQCSRMNTKPSVADYDALKPAAEARAAQGGIGPALMPFRGPDEMHVTLMPGIVADPGHAAPVSDVAPGFDLDGDDGSAAPPNGIRQHRNFVSLDGRRGIDNQLFTVEGCVEGFRRRGFLPMIFNEGRAVGRPTAILEVSGIDDPRNDDQVTVTVLYSEDELRRSPAKTVLPDFTYRISRNPAFAQDFTQLRGRIVDGVLTTEPAEQLHIHEVIPLIVVRDAEVVERGLPPRGDDEVDFPLTVQVAGPF